MAEADAAALTPDREQYHRWYSLLQQTFGREPGQTHSLTEVALRALSEGAAPDQALEAAHTAAKATAGVAAVPVGTPANSNVVTASAAPIAPAPATVAAATVSASDGAAPALEPVLPGMETLADPSSAREHTVTTPVTMQPWWTQPLLVGLLLLVLPPLGLYLLWSSDRFPHASRVRVTVIVLGCWAVVVALVLVAAFNTSTTTKV
jgi:hypothetical protein